MKKIFVTILLLIIYMPISYAVTNYDCKQKMLFGQIENVILENKFKIAAKMDTGAALSSLSATHIAIFKKQNQTWVRFNLDFKNNKQKIIMIKPLVRLAHIKKREEETKFNSRFIRPVINLKLCIGHQQKMINVNLTNRSQFKYPMIIGSDALKAIHAIVDVSATSLTQPNCSSHYPIGRHT